MLNGCLVRPAEESAHDQPERRGRLVAPLVIRKRLAHYNAAKRTGNTGLGARGYSGLKTLLPAFLFTILGMLRHKLIAAVMLVLTLAWPALAAAAPEPQEFSNDVASRLLQQVTQGFITNNQGQVLAAFDAARMKNYTQFRDDIVTLFAKYESFRAAYRLRQSWPQGQHGVVIVEFELEGTPLNEGVLPFRRSAQLRFEFERGRKGWRIVDVAPRRFFS